jgi:tRNA U38,U39,U40 pseudouridine synthase TruA
MVRLLVCTMVDVGLARRPLSDIELLFEVGDNQRTSPPAPPQGLYFVRAAYPAELYLVSEISDTATRDVTVADV